MLIRPATTRDARAIARLHVRDWQIAYRGIVPDEYLARLSVEWFSNRLLARFAELTPWQTIVAVDDDEVVVGYASFGANQSDLSPEIGELGAIYVDVDRWDQGIGGTLLAEAERGLVAGGYESAVLWTLGGNERTRRFYERRGWRFDGTADTHPSGAEVVRYVKSLTGNVDPETTAEYDSSNEQT
jgi:GNAT superfamily N-acetyltransferase